MPVLKLGMKLYCSLVVFWAGTNSGKEQALILEWGGGGGGVIIQLNYNQPPYQHYGGGTEEGDVGMEQESLGGQCLEILCKATMCTGKHALVIMCTHRLSFLGEKFAPF